MTGNLEPCQVLCEEPRGLSQRKSKYVSKFNFFFLIRFDAFQPYSSTLPSFSIDRDYIDNIYNIHNLMLNQENLVFFKSKSHCQLPFFD